MYISIEYCSLSVNIPLLDLNNKWTLGQKESAIQKQNRDLGHKYSSCIHTFLNNPTPKVARFELLNLILDHGHDHETEPRL